MKKKHILITLIIIAAVSIAACLYIMNLPVWPVKPVTFGGAKYDSARDLIITEDGFLLAGLTTSSGVGYINGFLLKLDSHGNRKWENTFGGQHDDRLACVINAGNGDYAAAGSTSSFGAGNNDFYLVKTDANGNLKYSRAFGGKGRDEANSIIQTPDGGFLLAGLSDSFKKAGFTDIYIVRTDSEGNSLWAKTIGGKKSDEASCVIDSKENGFIIAGTTSSFGAGPRNMIMVNIDSRGNTLWMRTYGGAADASCSRVIKLESGNYALAGSISTKEKKESDIIVVETDAKGNSMWSKTYGGAGIDQGVSIQECPDKTLVIGATSESFSYGSSDLALIKTDAQGNTLWIRHYGGRGDDYLGNFQVESDGSIAAAGWVNTGGQGTYGAYFFKTDKNGGF